MKFWRGKSWELGEARWEGEWKSHVLRLSCFVSGKQDFPMWDLTDIIPWEGCWRVWRKDNWGRVEINRVLGYLCWVWPLWVGWEFEYKWDNINKRLLSPQLISCGHIDTDIVADLNRMRSLPSICSGEDIHWHHHTTYRKQHECYMEGYHLGRTNIIVVVLQELWSVSHKLPPVVLLLNHQQHLG